ncbi:MAG: hypothetical protein GX442_25570 [Candidatus Riflebacteria bacterium]|nr:hypothetical protein [Candidatus Riflebacteria bacterium]
MRNRLVLVCTLVAFVLGAALVGHAIPRDEKKPVTDHGVKMLPVKAELVGEWRGLAETRNFRVAPESLKLVFKINADGTVTGRVGDWKLVDAVCRRTDASERQNWMSDFVIIGAAEGMQYPANGKNQIMITVDFKGMSAYGSVRGFAVQNKTQAIVKHAWNIIHLNMYPIK